MSNFTAECLDRELSLLREKVVVIERDMRYLRQRVTALEPRELFHVTNADGGVFAVGTLKELREMFIKGIPIIP